MSNQFSIDVSRFVSKAKGNVSTVIRKVAFDLGSRIIMRTPVRTGRARANWMFGIGSPNTTTTTDTDIKTPVNSAGKGSSKAKAAFLAALSNYDPATGKPLYITNSLDYIHRLEYGWSKQAPSGMVRLTLAEFLGITHDAVKFVRSGGKM